MKLAWQVSPDYIIVLILQSVTSALKLWLNIILPKYLIDELLGAKNMQMILLFGGLIIANNVGMAWLEKLYKRMVEVKKEYMRRKMTERMAEKIMNLEYSYLEDPYYLDLKERAVFAIGNLNAIAQIVTVVSRVFSGAITLAGLLAIIASLGPVMILVLAADIAIMLLLYKNMSKTMVQVMQNIIPINRKYGYYIDLEMQKQYQKDIRLYGMENMIIRQLYKFSEETCDLFDEMYKKQGQAFGGINVANDAIAAICYVYVGLRTLTDRFGSRISIGSLTMYVSAAVNFSTSVVSFGTSVVEMFQELSYLDPYIEFMGLEEETIETGKEKFTGPVETVEFSNVTFTYPKAEKPVLKNVSFSIHKGEKISIAGF